MGVSAIEGLLAPILTPFDDDLSIATDLYVAHAQQLLAEGCSGLVPFGTTGEAPSVGIDERIAAIRDLIQSGIDPRHIIAGTGLTDIADTVRLSRACLDMGCAGLLVLPPYYFKSVDEDGLFRYFAQLAIELGADARIYLYHIPPIAVVGIPPALVRRLHEEFPRQIVGIKDSSGDWDNTRQLLQIEGLAVYPGSELPLLDAVGAGAPGCITATANVNAGPIAQLLQLLRTGDVAAACDLHASIARFRHLIQDHRPIPAQKRLLALRSSEPRWANVRPPLTSMPEDQGRELTAILAHDFGWSLRGL